MWNCGAGLCGGWHPVQGLLQAAEGASGALQLLGWPVLMKNRIALGLAGVWHGGRSHEGLEDHRLRVADFLPATAADFDATFSVSSTIGSGSSKSNSALAIWCSKIQRPPLDYYCDNLIQEP